MTIQLNTNQLLHAAHNILLSPSIDNGAGSEQRQGLGTTSPLFRSRDSLHHVTRFYGNLGSRVGARPSPRVEFTRTALTAINRSCVVAY